MKIDLENKNTPGTINIDNIPEMKIVIAYTNDKYGTSYLLFGSDVSHWKWRNNNGSDYFEQWRSFPTRKEAIEALLKLNKDYIIEAL